jgi:hypothetical protein
MSQVPPLMSQVPPLFSWVAPLFSQVPPLFYLKGIYIRGLDLHKKSLHKKVFTQMQQVEVHAKGMVSELASDPCRRHVLQLVINVKQSGSESAQFGSSLPLLFWKLRVPHFWIARIKKEICLSNNFTKQ